MSFGDLITLLLFVLFVVAPAFNRSRRTAPPRPGRRVEPTGGSDEPARSPFEDELAKRVEEARERVRRAMESEPGRAGAPEGTPPSAAPASATTAKPLVADPPRPLVAAPPPPLVAGQARSLMAGPARPLVAGPARSLAASARAEAGGTGRLAPGGKAAADPRDLRREAPALMVERGPAAQGGWHFDPRFAREGFIWHQILGRPRSRERRGGTPYRHP